ncbi:hypothetical protein, partial [Streptococcus oralis]|uniref:hypothetical protein n=1 Tax=Streptococcus oralis TaxID=1303 RepID=UPI001909BF8A
MKKSKAKYLTLASVVLSAGILLSACGNSNSASKTYNYVYSSDPSSLNYLAENRATTNDQGFGFFISSIFQTCHKVL